jgi:predicted amidophosphoribosyltransferase
MASISCPGCGNEVSDLAPVCSRCLKPIASTRTEPRPPERAPGAQNAVLLVALNLIILFGFLLAIAILTS